MCSNPNRSKLKPQTDPKTENRTKQNNIGCVWITFYENRLDWIRFGIDFSKLNQTEPNCIHIF